MERRSIRRYRSDPIPREVVSRLLMLAGWAPSAHNRQPWRFAVVETPDRKTSLAQAMGARLRHDLEADGVPEPVIVADVARSHDRITAAPVLVILCLSMQNMDVYTDAHRNLLEKWMAVQSVAMAGQNLLLAAHDAGLGACWMCAPLFAPDIVTAVLDLPQDWEPQGMLTLGYPAQEREKTRNEVSVVWR